MATYKLEERNSLQLSKMVGRYLSARKTAINSKVERVLSFKDANLALAKTKEDRWYCTT